MLPSRRNFLKSLFIAPAVISAANLMPVKVMAALLPEEPKYRISPGVLENEIDISYRYPRNPNEALEQALQNALFEPNNSFTRTQVQMQMESYLQGLQANREIYDYTVVCDTTNNPPNVIDNNELYTDVYIRPARSIEYINLRAVATPTRLDFSTLMLRNT